MAESVDTSIIVGGSCDIDCRKSFFNFCRGKDIILCFTVNKESDSKLFELLGYIRSFINSINENNFKEVLKGTRFSDFERKYGSQSNFLKEISDNFRDINRLKEELTKVEEVIDIIISYKVDLVENYIYPRNKNDVELIINKKSLREMLRKTNLIKLRNEKDGWHIMLCQDYGEKSKDIVIFVCNDRHFTSDENNLKIENAFSNVKINSTKDYLGK
tara:strand:- start:282 stop:929 length:648 start_codon:yes stop_codon:yes gene_type:complete